MSGNSCKEAISILQNAITEYDSKYANYISQKAKYDSENSKLSDWGKPSANKQHAICISVQPVVTRTGVYKEG